MLTWQSFICDKHWGRIVTKQGPFSLESTQRPGHWAHNYKNGLLWHRLSGHFSVLRAIIQAIFETCHFLLDKNVQYYQSEKTCVARLMPLWQVPTTGGRISVQTWRCDHLKRRCLLKSCSTEQDYQQSQEPWKFIEIEPDRYRRYWLFTIYKKSFRKIRLGSIWNTNFWVIFWVIHSSCFSGRNVPNGYSCSISPKLSWTVLDIRKYTVVTQQTATGTSIHWYYVETTLYTWVARVIKSKRSDVTCYLLCCLYLGEVIQQTYKTPAEIWATWSFDHVSPTEVEDSDDKKEIRKHCLSRNY